MLADGTALAYEVLSLNVGSTLRAQQARHAQILPLHPLALLRQRYEPVSGQWQLNDSPSDCPFVVTALG